MREKLFRPDQQLNCNKEVFSYTKGMQVVSGTEGNIIKMIGIAKAKKLLLLYDIKIFSYLWQNGVCNHKFNKEF